MRGFIQVLLTDVWIFIVLNIDGKLVAIGRNGELQRVSLDGTTIDEFPFRVPADARPLSMSPDGETILYRQNTSETQCWSIDVIYLVDR